jgi:hypothetical protein
MLMCNNPFPANLLESNSQPACGFLSVCDFQKRVTESVLAPTASYLDGHDLKSARATSLTTGEPGGAPVHCDDFPVLDTTDSASFALHTAMTK